MREALGPCFGNCELMTEEPFNFEKQCCSLSNQAVYQIGESKKEINILTKQKVNCIEKKQRNIEENRFSEFTISELEVWEVRFLK